MRRASVAPMRCLNPSVTRSLLTGRRRPSGRRGPCCGSQVSVLKAVLSEAKLPDGCREEQPKNSGGARSGSAPGVVLRVALREAGPLVGQLVLGEAGVHGAGLDAGVAVDAL